jgi:hypothetical protein
MADDDPLVNRTIRTPKATITIHGDLSQVDELYRLFTQSLLSTGKYTIPKPGENPWQEYEDTQQAYSPDFLRRRNQELERQLAESESHETIRQLRTDLAAARMETGVFKQGFTALSENVDNAVKSLRDDPNPNLYTHIAFHYLAPEE